MQLKINSKLSSIQLRSTAVSPTGIISQQIHTENPKASHWTGLKKKIVRIHVSVADKISYLHFCIMSRFKLSHSS